MHHTSSIGSLGESCAAHFLESLGYTILARNVWFPFGELDIVSRDPEGILTIVEVKTFDRPGRLSPEDNLTRSKFSRLSKTAAHYTNQRPELLIRDLGWRIDLVSIILNPSPNLTHHKFGEINFAVSHYQNVLL